MAPSLAVEAVIEVFVESLLYGLYILLFIACIHVLIFRRKGTLNIPLLVVSLALFACITIHEVVDAGRAIYVFGTFKSTTEINAWYAKGLTGVWNVLNDSVLVTSVIISDVFLLYRCYVVWERRLAIIIVPSLVFLADMAGGIALPISQSQGNGPASSNPSFAAKQQHINTLFMASTFTLNAICTGLIAFRILKFQFDARSVGPLGGSSLGNVAMIVIESGAIYLLATASTLAAYLKQSTVMYVLVDVTVPIIGIVFSLIIVRIGLQISFETTQKSEMTTLAFTPARNRHSSHFATSSTGIDTTSSHDHNNDGAQVNLRCPTGTLPGQIEKYDDVV